MLPQYNTATTKTQAVTLLMNQAYHNHRYVPYILESNPHPFYSFRGLKNQMRIRNARRLDSQSRAGFWKNVKSRCTCRKNNKLQ
jgi:hypothetical protein